MADDLWGWIDALPKVELHLHLEGAIPLPALYRWIGKYGGDGEISSLDDLRQRLSYKDFPDFIAAWIWKNGFIRSYQDFTDIAASEAVAHWIGGGPPKFVSIEPTKSTVSMPPSSRVNHSARR